VCTISTCPMQYGRGTIETGSSVLSSMKLNCTWPHYCIPSMTATGNLPTYILYGCIRTCPSMYAYTRDQRYASREAERRQRQHQSNWWQLGACREMANRTRHACVDDSCVLAAESISHFQTIPMSPFHCGCDWHYLQSYDGGTKDCYNLWVRGPQRCVARVWRYC
jgi:hypothetical protein